MVDDGASNSVSSDQSSKPGASFDDSSKSSFQTNTTATGTIGPTGASIPEAILATKETRAVHYSRIIVLAVLAISAAMAGGLTFWLFTESEKGDFKVQVSTFYFMLHYLSFVAF
jgi:H+/Cl- antiporter ClcA